MTEFTYQEIIVKTIYNRRKVSDNIYKNTFQRYEITIKEGISKTSFMEVNKKDLKEALRRHLL